MYPDGCEERITTMKVNMKLSNYSHGSIVRIGNQTFRLYRLEEFSNGLLGTMKRFPRLQPCFYREKFGWVDDHKAQWHLGNWNDECELVDNSHTAIAGERLTLK